MPNREISNQSIPNSRRNALEITIKAVRELAKKCVRTASAPLVLGRAHDYLSEAHKALRIPMLDKDVEPLGQALH